MLNFIVEVIIWCFCIYGILNLIKDIIDEKSYKKVKNNTKLILTVKDAENGIENYIRDLNFSKNFFNNLVVIDLNSKDKTVQIVQKLIDEGMNIRLLNQKDGIEYLEKTIAPK
jgi:hypothetical protein